jgi:phage baseplate assembly protein W
MPVERISKGFKDISMTFKANPLNNDILVIKNENAIARSLRNLVMTVNGESPYEETLGSGASRILFSNMDELSSDSLRDGIKRVIENYEPRVSLIKVEVDENFDNNTYNVRIAYKIIGIDVPAQQLTFALRSAR